MIATYHSHTTFCDGKAAPADMAEAAWKAGYGVLGFSAHAPIPIPSQGNLPAGGVIPYSEAIRDVKAQYENRMEVLTGLEIEWVPGIGIPSDEEYASRRLDFRIGSLHFVQTPRGDYLTVDGPEQEFNRRMLRGYGEDGVRLYKDYYRELTNLVQTGGFEILGHLDIIKKNNLGDRWFGESDRAYLRTAFTVAEALEGTGIIVEVNTGGMARGKTKEPYPSLPILKELKRRRVPVVIGADAHAPDHLDMKWRQIGVEWARAAGYRELAILSQGRWTTAPLE